MKLQGGHRKPRVKALAVWLSCLCRALSVLIGRQPPQKWVEVLNVMMAHGMIE